MKFFVTILIILTFKGAVSQTTPILLLDKAYNFIYEEKKIDSGLKCYQTLQRLFPDFDEANTLVEIAFCFLKMGDTAHAEDNFLKCLKIDMRKDSFGTSQTYACAKLSEIYFTQKKFRDALTYLDFTETDFKPLKTECQGGFGPTNKIRFAYKKAQCYYGLNKKDSLIITLAPYIFRPAGYYYLDSLEYRSISTFFASAIFESYGKCDAKTQLLKSLNKVSFNLKTIQYRGSSLNWVGVECSIRFFDIQINLDNGINYGLKKEDPIPSNLSKEYLLGQFTNSLSYKIIVE